MTPQKAVEAARKALEKASAYEFHWDSNRINRYKSLVLNFLKALDASTPTDAGFEVMARKARKLYIKIRQEQNYLVAYQDIEDRKELAEDKLFIDSLIQAGFNRAPIALSENKKREIALEIAALHNQQGVGVVKAIYEVLLKHFGQAPGGK